MIQGVKMDTVKQWKGKAVGIRTRLSALWINAGKLAAGSGSEKN